jgi:hypothetical protein
MHTMQCLAVWRVWQVGGNNLIFGPCAELYPSHEDSWRCLFAEHRLPGIATPTLLTAPLFDSVRC